MNKWIIFDFDNTIADALTLWIDSYNQVAPRYGYGLVNDDNREILRNQTAWQIKNALGVKIWTMPFARRAMRRLFSERVSQLQFVPGMKEAVQEFRARGYRMGIFTSNRYDNVSSFLTKHGCRDWFEFIEPEASLFFKSRQFHNVLRKRKIDPAAAVYIGDETKDVDAAKSAGCRSVAVTWGVNSKAALASHRPDVLVDKPGQLLNMDF